MQGLGATEIAVYMTEKFEATGDASLKPLVVYPEIQNIWPDSIQWQLGTTADTGPWLLEATVVDELEPTDAFHVPVSPSIPEPNLTDKTPDQEQERQQIVLPLIHDNAVLGVLMVARFGPTWTGREQSQVEQVAQTLSMACLLDQRSQWLSRSGFEKQALLSDEHQRLSKLLHQFRNPLTALRTLGKLMVRRMTTQDPNREFAQSIVQQSDRLEIMLQEFSQTLDVGEEAIDQFDQPWTLGPVEPSPALPPAVGVISGANLSLQPCWLSEILTPIVSASVGRLEEHGMQLKQSISNDLPPVNGDLQALTEVFSNLLDNAIKYTPDGGTVTIELTRENSDDMPPHQIVYITDTGMGIPQEEIPGTGLGLAIARELVQKMDGTIEAFSPALVPPSAQGGSTFKVTLPELNRSAIRS